jgi:hypothetical protein
MRSVLDNYIAMSNEADPASRRWLIAETVTEDAGYVDPSPDPRSGAPMPRSRR